MSDGFRDVEDKEGDCLCGGRREAQARVRTRKQCKEDRAPAWVLALEGGGAGRRDRLVGTPVNGAPGPGGVGPPARTNGLG